MAETSLAVIGIRERRDQVVTLLGEAFSRNLLEVEQLEHRLELVHQADSVAALDELVSDLAVPTTSSTALAPVEGTALDRPATKRLTAVFGAVEKRGRWTPARKLTATAVFGATVLDLREADLPLGVTELRVRVMFGAVELIVPPWLAIETDATAVFGAVEDRNHDRVSADATRRVLHVTGVTVFGAVEIDTRRPGESKKDARRREKREAKERRPPAPLGLPTAVALPPKDR